MMPYTTSPFMIYTTSLLFLMTSNLDSFFLHLSLPILQSSSYHNVIFVFAMFSWCCRQIHAWATSIVQVFQSLRINAMLSSIEDKTIASPLLSVHQFLLGATARFKLNIVYCRGLLNHYLDGNMSLGRRMRPSRNLQCDRAQGNVKNRSSDLRSVFSRYLRDIPTKCKPFVFLVHIIFLVLFSSSFHGSVYFLVPLL